MPKLRNEESQVLFPQSGFANAVIIKALTSYLSGLQKRISGRDLLGWTDRKFTPQHSRTRRRMQSNRPRGQPIKLTSRKNSQNDLVGLLSGLALFKRLVVAYRNEYSIESYVAIKHEFPELEIQVGYFGGFDVLLQLEKELAGQSINPQLVASSLDGDEPSIDAVSLCLLELLIARSKLPKGGHGYIEKRRNATSDVTINYLIVVMLEALDWQGEEIRIPASLVVLIREQLCGSRQICSRCIVPENDWSTQRLLLGKFFIKRRNHYQSEDWQLLPVWVEVRLRADF